MSIHHRVAGNVHVLELVGQLHPERFRDMVISTIINSGATQVVIDCRKLTFVSSGSLAELIWLQQRISSYGKLRLVGLQPKVRRIFSESGILGMFDSQYADVESAVASFNGGNS